MKNKEVTPFDELKNTFNSYKKENADAVFLFRKSNFYEVFLDDVNIVSAVTGVSARLLEIKADPRCERVPYLCFPHYALDIYLPRLIRAGHRVCICDPIALPDSKVLEMITPYSRL